MATNSLLYITVSGYVIQFRFKTREGTLRDENRKVSKMHLRKIGRLVLCKKGIEAPFFLFFSIFYLFYITLITKVGGK